MRLTDCFIELIAYVSYFLKGVSSRPLPYDRVKTDIGRLIAESEERVKGAGFSREDYELARFAVFAWIDESVVGSSWKERDRWLREPLQRLHFSRTDAGETFFERLNTLGPHQRDVREIYYLCLTMGFTGRYCNEGDEYLLEQLKTSNLKVLKGSSLGVPSIEKEVLFPQADSKETPKAIPAKNRRFSTFKLFWIGFPFLFLCASFFLFRFILANKGEDLLNMVP